MITQHDMGGLILDKLGDWIDEEDFSCPILIHYYEALLDEMTAHHVKPTDDTAVVARLAFAVFEKWRSNAHVLH